MDPYRFKASFASSTILAASSLLCSNPHNFTYVVLFESVSLPAVLPSSSDVAVTSRMSSATIISKYKLITYAFQKPNLQKMNVQARSKVILLWKASPILVAKISHCLMSSSDAPAKIAPDVTLTFTDRCRHIRMNFQVLNIWFNNIPDAEHFVLPSVGLLFCEYVSIPNLLL